MERAFACGVVDPELGWALIVADRGRIVSISLDDSESELMSQAPGVARDASLDACLIALREGRDVPLPLAPNGTLFQQRVWTALTAIPRGQTRTYEALARELGTSARAVASACAGNPVAIAIPCHRVIRKDGGLAGYRWGLARKEILLAREGALGQPRIPHWFSG